MSNVSPTASSVTENEQACSFFVSDKAGRHNRFDKIQNFFVKF